MLSIFHHFQHFPHLTERKTRQQLWNLWRIGWGYGDGVATQTTVDTGKSKPKRISVNPEPVFWGQDSRSLVLCMFLPPPQLQSLLRVQLSRLVLKRPGTGLRSGGWGPLDYMINQLTVKAISCLIDDRNYCLSLPYETAVGVSEVDLRPDQMLFN